jgi:AcrR family transcriptional regulator
MPDGLRSRTRRAMRAEVAAIALDLFLDQGFDNTTVEQITAAAGISRSSFFRYFPTKEDVFLGDLVEYGERILRTLRERPEKEPPWTSLRVAIGPILPAAGDTRALRTSRMFIETPTLRARHYEKTLTWQRLLVPEVARRMKVHSEDPRPAALISCVLACLDVALVAWTSSNGRKRLAALLDMAMNSVGPPTVTH